MAKTYLNNDKTKRAKNMKDISPQRTPCTSMSQILGQHADQLNADKRVHDIQQANAFQQEKDTVI